MKISSLSLHFFLTNYGKALSITDEYEKAAKISQKATKFYPNAIVYKALGNSYKATGQNKNAEADYLHAWYLNPSHFPQIPAGKTLPRNRSMRKGG